MLRGREFAISGHNHAYLPALGYPATNAAALSLLLGAKSTAIKEGRAFAAQVSKQHSQSPRY